MGTSSPMIRFSNLTFESDYDNDEDLDDDEDAEDEEDEKEDEKKLGAKVTAANLLIKDNIPISNSMLSDKEWKEKLMSFITGRFSQIFRDFFPKRKRIEFDETRQ